MCRLVLFAALGFLVVGCAPSEREVEQVIREGLKVDHDVDVATINLTKQPDGGYLGTATATNGDTYDVTVEPPKGGRVRWRAAASQAMVERFVRERIEERYFIGVKTLELKKQSNGTYTGTAELVDDSKIQISVTTTGQKLHWQIELMQ